MLNEIEQFKAAMLAAGLEPPDLIEPGKLHRFASNGKRGDDAGWCKLFADQRGGVFGDHRRGLSEHWQAKTGRVMTASERDAFQRMVADSKHQAELEERKRHEVVARKAVAILDAATDDPATHPYAIKKRVPLGSLVKRGLWLQRGWGDALLVPIYGVDGRVQSIEAINTDGKKDALKDGDKRGGFYPFGKIRGAGRVLIGEGVATLAVGAEVDQSPAAAALCTSNLKAVGLAVRELAAPGADIIILADNDVKPDGRNPGVEGAMESARSIGTRVAIPELAGRKCDFWDLWNERGIEAVRAALANAKSPVMDEPGPDTDNVPGGHSIDYRRVSDIHATPIRWLWPGRIARGKVTMLAGHPGLGKSQVTASMAAIVSIGGTWPVDRTHCEQGSVIILSAEDDPEDTIRPRLEAAGADLTRVYTVDAIREPREDGILTVRAFSLATDIELLGHLARKLGDVALIVIDPITAYLGAVDSHKNAEVRGLLAPLAAMAAERGAAVVCVSHLNKAGGTEAMLRVMGSLGFVAAARGAYLVAKDPDDDRRRLFLPMKNNIAEDAGGLAFRVMGRDLGSGIATSSVEWDAERVTMTADEAMAPQGDPEERSALEEAKEFLSGLLTNGPVAKRDIERDADGAGHSWATVRRAQKALGIVPEKEGMKGPWLWRMPTKVLKRHEDAHQKNVSTFGENEHLRELSGSETAVVEGAL